MSEKTDKPHKPTKLELAGLKSWVDDGERIAELEAELERTTRWRCETCYHRHFCQQTVGYGSNPVSFREVTFCSRYWEAPMWKSRPGGES